MKWIKPFSMSCYWKIINVSKVMVTLRIGPHHTTLITFLELHIHKVFFFPFRTWFETLLPYALSRIVYRLWGRIWRTSLVKVWGPESSLRYWVRYWVRWLQVSQWYCTHFDPLISIISKILQAAVSTGKSSGHKTSNVTLLWMINPYSCANVKKNQTNMDHY